MKESGNNPARVMLLSIPSKKEIVSKSLYNVSEFRMHWQENGDYLCVKVDKVKAKVRTRTQFYFDQLISLIRKLHTQLSKYFE